MLGLMQDWPLLCNRIIDHAATFHGDRTLLTRSIEGPLVTTNYRELRRRALRVAKALEADGVTLGDRVGTMAWNTARHLETWYGILGLGAVYHTLNPRLFPDDIIYIANHAEDKVLFLDLTFVPLVETLQDRLPLIERYIILTDGANMPETTLTNAVAYEDFIGAVDDDFAWKEFNENTAAGMCYTSGTTGKPKGVVYSHRSNVVHSMATMCRDMFGLSCMDTFMPVVPMFHANGWSIAFGAPMAGAAMVMPGGKMDGESIYEMLETGKVTTTAAVPTVWLMLLGHLEESGKKLNHLQRVIIGGSAVPRAMIEKFQDAYGVEVDHAWGMTEMNPIGSFCRPKPETAHITGPDKTTMQLKQGWAPFTVEYKLTDDDGNLLPWDGTTVGRLKVRGPAIAKSYFKGEGGEILDEEGFFDTGDVVNIDRYGYMQITDRSKDVIKSGGEWISSIDLENEALGAPGVAEAAVIGIAHPKWDERPLLVIVKKPGVDCSKEDVLKHLEGRIAKWWMPDDVVFVDEIPHTATGKIQKTALRDQFKEYSFPAAAAE